MWIKAGIFGGTRYSNLAVWTMAGLGITMSLYACRKWVEYSIKQLGVFAWEEDNNGIDRLTENDNLLPENDNGIDRLPENDNGIDRLPENDNGIDRLPDDVLCKIVSELGALEASRTSILSRRWRNIWTMNPELMLGCLYTFDVSQEYHDYVTYGDKRRLLKAVDQCLQLYSGRYLKHFFLHCCFLNGNNTCHLVRWMQTLSRFDVEKLYLGISCQKKCKRLLGPLKPFTFSFDLIDGFSRLEYLDLVSCYVETTPVSRFNSLMTINLRCIPLSLSHQLSDILLSCPKLTRLCLILCKLPPNLRISGPDLKLLYLKLYLCYNVRKLEISDINVVTIKIDISTEVEVSLSSLPKLEKLHLATPGMNYCFGDAPKQMPQLKYLLVQQKYQILRLPPTFQVFGNVRVLRLTTRGDPYRGACAEVDLWNFAPVLVACPFLEKFYLQVEGPACKEERKGQWPVLQHKHLEYMELSGFTGKRNELEFAKFIASSAQVLQTLVLLKSSGRGYDLGVAFAYILKGKDYFLSLLKDYFISEHATLEIE